MQNIHLMQISEIHDDPIQPNKSKPIKIADYNALFPD
jgi:hypothetical protein